MRCLVVIPALNEEKSIAAVIEGVTAADPSFDVLVVNDGSTDETASVAQAAGAQVLTLPFNLGVGGAMRAGYKFAERGDYDVAIQVDADGQHDPNDLSALIAGLADADIVIGARFAGRGDYVARGPRRWAMRLLARSLSRRCGVPLTDVTSGFRAANRRAIELFALNYPAEYLGDTVESLISAARVGLTVRQIPVVMRPRQGGAPSQTPLRAAVYFGRSIMVLGLASIRRPPVVAQR